MIGVAVVADSGPALEAMTQGVSSIPGAHIVRHCHGHAPIGAALARFTPDLVIVDEMGWPRLALRRIAELRAALPETAIVVRASQPEAGWLADALHSGARAVVPATAGAQTLARVIAEVLRELDIETQPAPTRLAA
jgi:DNA-binding NarL/FixJ family response regulator